MMEPASLLGLLASFRAEGVEYVLVGGQAVRLNGYVRATEGIDVLDIEGLLRTKTDYREIDLLDKQVLTRIKNELKGDHRS